MAPPSRGGEGWEGIGPVGTRLERVVAELLFQEIEPDPLPVHIPVENEHLFRFKMNADSGLRVHRFRTPQSTYSDVR